MPAEVDCERLEIFAVGGDDVVAVVREQDERRVDRVAFGGAREQLPGGAAETLVECAYVDAPKRFGKQRLTGAATAPSLTYDTAMGNGRFTRYQARFQTTPHRAIVFFERDQSSAV